MKTAMAVILLDDILNQQSFQHFLISGLNYCHSLLIKKSSHFLNSLKQNLLTIHLLHLKTETKIQVKKQTHQKKEITR